MSVRICPHETECENLHVHMCDVYMCVCIYTSRHVCVSVRDMILLSLLMYVCVHLGRFDCVGGRSIRRIGREDKLLIEFYQGTKHITSGEGTRITA